MATCMPICSRIVGRLFSQLTTEGYHILGHFDFGGFHCCVRATQSDKKDFWRACRRGVLDPTTGIQWERLTPPLVQQSQRFFLRHGAHQKSLGWRNGQHLERDFGDEAQRSPTARQQSTDIVAGHILHDLTAKCEVLTASVDEAHAQNKIANRAHTGPRWTTQTRGNHATNSGLSHLTWQVKMWRLECQALPFFGQRIF